MSMRAWWIGLWIGMLACKGSSRLDKADDAPTQEVSEAPDGPLIVHRTSHTSLLDEQRQVGTAPLGDFQTTFRAVAVDRANMRPMETTAGFQVSGAPVFWLSAAGDAVVVDHTVFTELSVVDAIRLREGQRKELGQLLQPEAIEPRRLAELLLTADAILTWGHIGSELTLVGESNDDGWTGVFDGSHTYFTNEKNVVPIGFAMHVDTEGRISVTGR